MPTNHLIFCRPLLLLPSTFPSIKVFSNKSVLLIRWLIFTSATKYWSFSFNISPSVLLRTDFKGLSSLFQHHSSKASVLRRSFPYGPTHTCGEIIIEIKKMISAKFRLPLVGKERARPWWGRQVCHRDWFIVSSVKWKIHECPFIIISKPSFVCYMHSVYKYPLEVTEMSI